MAIVWLQCEIDQVRLQQVAILLDRLTDASFAEYRWCGAK